MRALFVSDGSFTTRERDMLARLEVGLIDEGAQLVRVVPASFAPPDDTPLTRSITFPDIGPGVMRPFRIAQMLERLAPLSPEPGAPPQFDIVHAWGDRCWILARELASVTGADLVIELWSQRSLDKIRRFQHAARSFLAMGRAIAWSAADNTIAHKARSLTTWTVAVHPWGVHVPPAPRRPTTPAETIPIVVLPEGHEPACTIALLRGLAQAIRTTHPTPAPPDRANPSPTTIHAPRPLILLDEAAVRSSRGVWRAIESLALAPITTILADTEARREPVLLAEILAMPEAGGEHRSIALEAMAAGQLLVPLHDPLVEAYHHLHTCFTVNAPTPHRWQQAFETLLADAALRRRIALGGRAWVEQHRPAYRHVTALLQTYHHLSNSNPTATAPAPANTPPTPHANRS